MRELVWQYGSAYMTLVNILAWGLFWLDKTLAIHHMRRVPEAVLLTVSLLGGWLGSLLSMYTWHHKTRKKKFTIGIPLMAAVWIVGFFAVLMM
ncbi:MAG: DUF1294 domain-containing protein [Clostridiales bacterium]|nr:DUF1294 domain-containing protein [Clostridiales bacterium]